jgi:hypothetical protein
LNLRSTSKRLLPKSVQRPGWWGERPREPQPLAEIEAREDARPTHRYVGQHTLKIQYLMPLAPTSLANPVC